MEYRQSQSQNPGPILYKEESSPLRSHFEPLKPPPYKDGNANDKGAGATAPATDSVHKTMNQSVIEPPSSGTFGTVDDFSIHPKPSQSTSSSPGGNADAAQRHQNDTDDEAIYDTDDDNCDSWYHTPFQVAPSVLRRRQLSGDSGQTARFIDPNCPSEHLVYDTGYILMKVKKRRVLQRWDFAKFYWIRYGRHRLYFFKSKEDSLKWINNHRLDKAAKDKLVTLSIDFERDSFSENILGYKTTNDYIGTYKRREVYKFELCQWGIRGGIKVGSFIPTIVGAFASDCAESLEKLHDIILSMIQANRINVRLQHLLLATSPDCYRLVSKIEFFVLIEDHDDYTEWLLQSKLEDCGFISGSPTSSECEKISSSDDSSISSKSSVI